MSNARELAELGGSYGTGGFVGMKNRIINGAMVIDQRNAGALYTSPASNTYQLDRWKCNVGGGGFNVQQNAGSVTPPVGFTNYYGVTSTSTSAASNYSVRQIIEGYNTADLMWGTANAQPVTVSFWVRSSLTGTFGGAIQNDAGNRSYVFSYTIASANTWQQVSVTIPGDTGGTWIGATNGGGIYLIISYSVATGQVGAAGSWSGNDYRGPTGQTNVVGTNGATWYITGVQLEKGSTATSFDYRPYGTELALCQRYYWKPTNGIAYLHLPLVGYADTSTTGVMQVVFPTTMRSGPSVTYSGSFQVIPGANGVSTFAVDAATGDVARLNITGSGFSTNVIKLIRNGNDTTAYIAFSSEL